MGEQLPATSADEVSGVTEKSAGSASDESESEEVKFDYYAVLDFECTCDKGTTERKFRHEIIEFPVVFLNSETLEVDLEFHRYVRPTEKPQLTEFCIELTGIQQSWVDNVI
ncbi:unnamed protein product [Cladocopium goreaui]|uniref:3'-5' exoribonuclease 1 (3'-5' exonuclease ERI1 ) (Eri-1 homolog) (Histone mRNA 3'-exonuclease 1) n=1 Tax=Cladocopium goreaui TaxID=2562237 RepID=A0A9P1CLN9_9DINO|nr:unnamed protein product [Cladocopium goreaui]